MGIHRDAAVTDPDIRAGVSRTLERRRAGLAALASALESDLASEITAAKAAAILDAITMPEVWTELISVHGWTADEYEAWVGHTLAQQLLDTERADDPHDPDPNDALPGLGSLHAPAGDLERMLAEIEAGREG